MKQFSYDIYKYQFREIISELFEVSNLNKIHENFDWPLLKRETDQSSKFHKIYYENFDKFKNNYIDFINEIIKPIFNEKIIYQKIPTFRIQIPNNIAVGEFHKDKWYSHNTEEINFFLPFTDAYETNTIWVESEEDLEDYSPINTKYGHFVMWDGNNLKHGNKINLTEDTRISVDFRVIPLSKYKEQEGESINMKIKFAIGDYYDLSN